MGKHRSRLKILAKILSVVSNNNGARKTQIMYQAYLSYKLLIQYLNDTVEAGLLKCENGNYLLTERGKNFLAQYYEYSESCDNLKEKLDCIEDQKSSLEEMCPSSEA
jgi:predicted transcriptional regulator